MFILEKDDMEKFRIQFSELVEQAYLEGVEKGKQQAEEQELQKEYLSFKDVNEIYDISRNTYNKWIELGLPLYKIDKMQFVKRTEVNAFIESYQVN